MLDPVRETPVSAACPEAGIEAAEDHGSTDSRALETPALITAELLVEDLSIDGMCGVY
jgi:mycofactocin precursor